MVYLSTLLLSMFVAVGLIPILTRAATRYQMVDYPNERKVHTHPVPRVGGVAIAFGALLPIFFLNHLTAFPASVLVGAGIIVGFGMLDDFMGLGYKTKFLGQIAAACVVVFYGRLGVSCLGSCLPDNYLLPQWVAAPLTILAIVAVTNAINLADGLDGLASGIMLLAFICIGYLGYTSGSIFIATTAFAMVGALFGFLRFNTFPASVFMGDTGSQLIGFLAIVLSVAGTQGNTAFSPFLPLLLLGFPVLDTAVVMAERIFAGKSPFKADKHHFHHKLIKMGFFHSEAVFTIYVIQAFFVTSAYFLRYYSEWFLLAYYVGSVLIMVVPFYVASGRGVCFQRTGFVDTVVKKRMKVLTKDKSIFIRISQGTIEAGLPLLFLFACFIPAAVSGPVSVCSLLLAMAVFLVSLFKKQWIGPVVRMIFYLLIPVVLFLGELHPAPWIGVMQLRLYNGFYLFISFGLILVLKMTRRKQGFKVTSTDFLIIFVALVVPNLPSEAIRNLHLGFLATRLIVFFFGIEVLIGELRGSMQRLGFSMIPALAVLLVRGL